VLITARDIIFLWVSRMVMTGLKFVGDKPFRDVVIHGIVVDKHGQKMSKMKGNIVDPMDLFEKYGVDATRITLAAASAGTDIRWRDEQVESYRNFANKIWNAARFCLLNSEGATVGTGFEGERDEWALHDRWILSRLNRTARDVDAAIKNYQFHEAVYSLYHFFWDDFCDWYIELSKTEVAAAEASPARDAARSRLLTILEQALRLLHPFMPFITEELWQRLPGVGESLVHPAYRGAEPTIMLTAYPQANDELDDDEATAGMALVIELISRVRSIRSEINVKPGERIDLLVSATDSRAREMIDKAFGEEREQITRLTRAGNIRFVEPSDIPRASARAALAGGAEVAVPLEGLIDFAQESERLRKEQVKLQTEAERLEKQLSNPQFTERAPAEKVAELRQRVADIAQRNSAIEKMMEALAE
jgi:valyl-tRNA synthetase